MFRHRLELRQQRGNKPFQIARAGRAAFLHEIVFRQKRIGVHQHAAIGHGRAAKVLVNAPGARNHADVVFVDHVDGNGACVDVKRAARNGRAFA
ncbi:hypothetical protein SDC9_172692 [bioreactor metagenome]|uniref:Uncharacterized protein n=1 Tax=bioreactor metagenome TaxID=1076179 RepID=A0A645GF16_9ZZZZ